MFTEIFQQLGLAKNEARIYETLLKEGESAVGDIANKASMHRRNVYDSLSRLVEKGLVFQILDKHEQHYQAVDPKKLYEIIDEKEHALTRIMPQLEEIYRATPHEEEAYVYRGIEGWKNYMRDILRVGEDLYTIGGKGAWADDRLKAFLDQFLKEAKRKNIAIHTLFDHEVKASDHKILGLVGKEYRFLDQKYSTSAAIDIFGNHIAILSGVGLGRVPDDATFTMIVSKNIAEAYRTWFQMMWDYAKQ